MRSRRRGEAPDAWPAPFAGRITSDLSTSIDMHLLSRQDDNLGAIRQRCPQETGTLTSARQPCHRPERLALPSQQGLPRRCSRPSRNAFQRCLATTILLPESVTRTVWLPARLAPSAVPIGTLSRRT